MNDTGGKRQEREAIMKESVSIIFTALCLLVIGCSHSTEPSNETPVAYTAYAGYSYGGPRPASDTTLFFQTTNESGFDSLFFFVSDHNPSPTIPSSDLSGKKIVSIVKYGNNYYSLQMSKVTLLGTTLRVYYTSTLDSANMSWVAAIPLIVTLDANYQTIQFIENGKQVNELTL